MIPPNVDAILAELDKKDAPILSLLASCRRPDYDAVWTKGPQLLRRFAQLLLKKGHPTLALEVASRGLEKGHYENDPELMYYRGLALARSGNPTKAEVFIRELLRLPGLSESLQKEALSLAGRIQKDKGIRSTRPETRLAHFREAFDYYHLAFELSGDYFPAINAATLALLIGEESVSRNLATTVRDQLLEQLRKPGAESDSWLLATLGEVYVLLGDQTLARGRYAQSVRLAQVANSIGDIATMKRQLDLLATRLTLRPDLLALFQLGPVIVFAGHGIDRPGETLRFPADPNLEDAVRQAIKNELDALESHIGYCSPGCGSDILFAELMQERSAELHLVLPFAEKDFLHERVTYGVEELASWQERYEKLRGFLRVPHHFATTEEYLADSILYDFCGTFMQGLALMRAAQTGVKAIALVVCDPLAHPNSVRLTEFMDNWKKTGQELRIIDLPTLRNHVNGKQVLLSAVPPRVVQHHTPRRSIKAMLFADVAGFSGLPESHLPQFFIDFLAIVAEELTTKTFANTWGDGLYVVFEGVIPCAEFALRLLKRLEKFDFNAHGFHLKEGKEPGVRIGLHTGPVFEGWDAILERNNFFGSHVSRAARIEPVTTPGCAFVSEQFAAALALAPGHSFVCEYLGLQPLAKDYDKSCPLYRLARVGDE